MIENKKYYSNVKGSFMIIISLCAMVFMFMIPFDYGNSSIFMFSGLDWILSGIIVFFLVIFFIGFIQAKRKKNYIYIDAGYLYMNTLFGKEKSISLTSEYKCKETKGKINYIVIRDRSKNNSVLLGGGYEVSLIEIKELLESYRKEKSTL